MQNKLASYLFWYKLLPIWFIDFSSCSILWYNKKKCLMKNWSLELGVRIFQRSSYLSSSLFYIFTDSSIKNKFFQKIFPGRQFRTGSSKNYWEFGFESPDGNVKIVSKFRWESSCVRLKAYQYLSRWETYEANWHWIECWYDRGR